MKRYQNEIIILLIQILMFYILPLFSKVMDAMVMILLILIATFILSVLITSISNNKQKYFYPLIISVLFIPSVFIYYNDSALIHTAWYFIDSVIGLLVGTIICKIITK